MILKSFKDQKNKKLKNCHSTNREATQNKQVSKKEEEDLTECARKKYFIDNLLMDDESKEDEFNPDNYRKNLECFSLVESKYRNCSYCGAS